MMKKQIFLNSEAHKKYLSLGGYRSKKLSRFLDNIIYDNIEVDSEFYIPEEHKELKQVQVTISRNTNNNIRMKSNKERITSNELLNYIIINEIK